MAHTHLNVAWEAPPGDGSNLAWPMYMHTFVKQPATGTVRTKPSYFHLVGGDNAFSPSYLGFWERVKKWLIWDHPELG